MTINQKEMVLFDKEIEVIVDSGTSLFLMPLYDLNKYLDVLKLELDITLNIDTVP